MMLQVLVGIFSLIFVGSAYKDYCSLPCSSSSGLLINSACDCSFGPKCEENATRFPLDKETKRYVVGLHNQLREKVASGSYDHQPRASNMAALVYDNDLAHVAECFASKCIVGHDKCRRTEKFAQAGQNFMKGMMSDCDKKEIFNMSVNMWFDEIQDATEDCIDFYLGCSGHYTQVVWAETTRVGCARVRSGHSCFVLCNYGPVGNVIGEPVYMQGMPACQTHTKYPHLCKVDEEGDENSSAGTFSSKVLLCIFKLVISIYLGYFIW